MALLILGLVLFLGIHTLTAARGARAAVMGSLGEGPYKGLYSLVSAAGLVLVVWGFGRYRNGGGTPGLGPPRPLYPLAPGPRWFALLAPPAAPPPPPHTKAARR